MCSQRFAEQANQKATWLKNLISVKEHAWWHVAVSKEGLK